MSDLFLLNRPLLNTIRTRVGILKRLARQAGFRECVKKRVFKLEMGPVHSVFTRCCGSQSEKDERVILDVTEFLTSAVEKEDRERQCYLAISSIVEKCSQKVSSLSENEGVVNTLFVHQVNADESLQTTAECHEECRRSDRIEVEVNNITERSATVKRIGDVLSEEVPEKCAKLQQETVSYDVGEFQNEFPVDAVMQCQFTDDSVTKPKEKKKKKKKKDRAVCDENADKSTDERQKRPNYFVAVKVSNPEIHGHLEKVQKHIIEQDKRLSSCMVPLSTLHITLTVMHIANEEEHTRALIALNDIYNESKESMSVTPLELEFRGLGHFRNQVLFAKVAAGEALARLTSFAENIPEQFEKASVNVTDKRAFTPHLTVMKLSRDPRLFRKGIKKICPSLYTMYENQLFGVQTVEGIQLLSMSGPKDKNGYYKGDELLFDIGSNPGDQ